MEWEIAQTMASVKGLQDCRKLVLITTMKRKPVAIAHVQVRNPNMQSEITSAMDLEYVMWVMEYVSEEWDRKVQLTNMIKIWPVSVAQQGNSTQGSS